MTVAGGVALLLIAKWGMWSTPSVLLYCGLIAAFAVRLAVDLWLKRYSGHRSYSDQTSPSDLSVEAPTPHDLSVQDKSLLAWIYDTEQQFVVFEEAFDCYRHLVVDGRAFYPWSPSSDGIEPRVHKDQRLGWLAIAGGLIHGGYLDRTGENVYRLSDKGISVGSTLGVPPFPNASERDEVLAEYREATEGLTGKHIKLLQDIQRSGSGRPVVVHLPDDRIDELKSDIGAIPRPCAVVNGQVLGGSNPTDRLKMYELFIELTETGFFDQQDWSGTPSGFDYTLLLRRSFRLSEKGKRLLAML